MTPFIAVSVPVLHSANQAFSGLSDNTRQAFELGGMALAMTALVSWLGFIVMARLEKRDPTSDYERHALPPNFKAIRDHDGMFNQGDFLKYAHDTFFAVQQSRQKNDPVTVRHLMSDDFWRPFCTAQLQASASRRRVVIEHLKLHSATIHSAVNINHWDAIVVRMVASCAEYEQDEKGRKYGDRHINSWREDWTFERSTDPHSHLRSEWALTVVTPVIVDRFAAQRRRSMTEWTPTEIQV